MHERVITMKNGIIVVMLIASLALFITGCSGGNTTDGGQAFLGGTDGLKMSFMAGNPPETIIDGGTTPFTITVKLENTGEYDVKANEGYVRIRGIDPGVFSVTGAKLEKSFDNDILGRVKNYDGSERSGQISTVSFEDLKYTRTIPGDIQQKVVAEVCYKYKTKAIAQVCVKPNAQQALNDDRICKVEGDRVVQNSGGPIAVTAMKQSFAGNGKISVTVTVTHAGSGTTFFKDTDNKCLDELTNVDKEKIKVNVLPVSIGGKTINAKCTSLTAGTTNNGYLKMYGGDSTGKASMTFSCDVDAGTIDNAFEVPLEIELDYRYLQSIETPLKIRHVAQ